MSNNQRWIAIIAALLLAATVGFAAWQAGVAHGIEQSGKIVVAPSGPYPAPAPYPYYPYHYGWHRPWGFGFLFIPLFFVFWIVLIRGVFWRRGWYGGGWYGGGCGPRGSFEEWHRHAHARDAEAGGAAERFERGPG